MTGACSPPSAIAFVVALSPSRPSAGARSPDGSSTGPTSAACISVRRHASAGWACSPAPDREALVAGASAGLWIVLVRSCSRPSPRWTMPTACRWPRGWARILAPRRWPSPSSDLVPPAGGMPASPPAFLAVLAIAWITEPLQFHGWRRRPRGRHGSHRLCRAGAGRAGARACRTLRYPARPSPPPARLPRLQLPAREGLHGRRGLRAAGVPCRCAGLVRDGPRRVACLVSRAGLLTLHRRRDAHAGAARRRRRAGMEGASQPLLPAPRPGRLEPSPARLRTMGAHGGRGGECDRDPRGDRGDAKRYTRCVGGRLRGAVLAIDRRHPRKLHAMKHFQPDLQAVRRARSRCHCARRELGICIRAPARDGDPGPARRSRSRAPHRGSIAG